MRCSNQGGIGFPLDGIPEPDLPALYVAHPAYDFQDVIETSRTPVPDVEIGDGEEEALLLELAVADAPFPHVVGSCRLTPYDMVAVVCKAHLIGLRVPDPDPNRGDGVGHP